MRPPAATIAPRLPFPNAYPLTACAAARTVHGYRKHAARTLSGIVASRAVIAANPSDYHHAYHAAYITAQRAYLANLRAARAALVA